MSTRSILPVAVSTSESGPCPALGRHRPTLAHYRSLLGCYAEGAVRLPEGWSHRKHARCNGRYPKLFSSGTDAASVDASSSATPSAVEPSVPIKQILRAPPTLQTESIRSQKRTDLLRPALARTRQKPRHPAVAWHPASLPRSHGIPRRIVPAGEYSGVSSRRRMHGGALRHTHSLWHCGAGGHGLIRSSVRCSARPGKVEQIHLQQQREAQRVACACERDGELLRARLAHVAVEALQRRQNARRGAVRNMKRLCGRGCNTGRRRPQDRRSNDAVVAALCVV